MDQSKASWLQSLADSVRTQRTKLGLTQQELSVLAGCGPVFIYDVENGRKATLRLDKLLDVLHVLGLRLVIEPVQRRLQASDRTS
ncbi:transcriptional regulator [Corallococcus sp. AB038B]|nr:transcriptional regulator [Corallococcus sp. AB038B]